MGKATARRCKGNEIRLTPDEIHAKRGRYRSVPLRRYLLPVQQTVEGMDIVPNGAGNMIYPTNGKKPSRRCKGNEIRHEPDEIHARRGRYRSVPLRRYLLPVQQTVEKKISSIPRCAGDRDNFCYAERIFRQSREIISQRGCERISPAARFDKDAEFG